MADRGGNQGMRDWLSRAAIGVVALLCGALSAHAQAVSPELQAIIDQAKKEDTVKLAWGEETLGGSAGAKRILDAINRAYGTHLEAKFIPLESMARVASQLVTELSASQAAFSDVYLGTSAQYGAVIGRNMFVPVDWTKVLPGRITPEIADGEGQAVKLATGLPGADYNTSTSPMIPKSLDDFLRPGWKGKIAATPYAAGFDALSANDLWGPEKTLDYVKKLLPQIGGLMGCTDEERIAVGEYSALVMNCLGEMVLPWQEKGAPIDRLIPLDAPVRRYYYLAVPKNAQNQGAAELFIAYMLTAAGQKLEWDLARVDLHYFPDSHTKAVIDKYEAAGVKFTDVTIDWWLRHPEIGPTTAEVIKLLSAAKK